MNHEENGVVKEEAKTQEIHEENVTLEKEDEGNSWYLFPPGTHPAISN